MPSWPQVLVGVAEAWREQRAEIDAQVGLDPRRACAAPQRCDGRRGRARRGVAGRRRHDAAPRLRLRATAASARAPKFPPRRRSSSCCAAASARWRCTRCARWRRAACTTRSAAASRATRSTRAGSSRTSRRCSTTTRCSRAPTCTAGRCRASRCFRRVCEETLGLHGARAAPGGGRLRLGPGRGLRGRRGQVLRVDARRGPSGAGRAGRRRHRALRDDRGRQLRGREHPGARDARSRVAARDQVQALRRARAAGAAGARRQAPDLLERAGDLRACRRRRGARRAALARRGRAVRRVHPARPARRGWAAAADLQPRAGEDRRLPRGPRVPARGAADALRGDVRRALVRRGPVARRRSARAVPGRRGRRLLLDRRRRRAAAWRGARRSTTRRSRAAGRLPRSACCGSPR